MAALRKVGFVMVQKAFIEGRAAGVFGQRSLPTEATDLNFTPWPDSYF
jgi:hypothetical protein